MNPIESTIVVEMGSYNCKVGFVASLPQPLAIIPTVVGHSKFNHEKSQIGPEDQLVGRDVFDNSCLVSPAYPIENGIITNFDEMERVWNHIFLKELFVDTEDHSVILVDSPLNRGQRAQIAEIMFEQFRIPTLYMTNKSRTALDACEIPTGVDVHCGEGVFYSAPIHNGRNLYHGIVKSCLGGSDINDFLLKVLNQRGYAFNLSREMEEIRAVKEKNCFVAWNFRTKLNMYKYRNLGCIHYLSNGDVVKLGDEMFRCTETMFKPFLYGIEGVGMHATVVNSIMRCDIHLREALFRNIIVSGGSSKCPGFINRLRNEIQGLVPPNAEVRLIANPLAHPAWTGAAKIAHHPHFRQISMTKDEFEEYGSQIIYMKCP